MLTNPIVFEWFEPMEEIIPKPSDVIQFEGGSIVLVTRWNDDGFSLQSIEEDYIDRGWFFGLLEKWGWVDPKYKYRDIVITNKAHRIGTLKKEC